MATAALAAAITLVTVHLIDGRIVIINPLTVTTIGEARGSHDPKKTLAPEARCVLNFVDGSHLSTKESCATVMKWIVDAVPKEAIK